MIISNLKIGTSYFFYSLRGICERKYTLPKKAQSLDYTIELYFVYVDSVEIAKQRVLLRVAAGGHGIPEADIERRYKESLEKLKDIIPLCDKVELYDNSKRFRRVALIKSGKTIVVSNDVPEWVRSLLK